jgi:uncharacterized membrane protein YtjA (UPF0391 family)
LAGSLTLAVQFKEIFLGVLMLNLAITLLILAVVAAVLGFGGMAGTLTGFAKIAFGIFVVLFILSLISHVVRGRGIEV